MSGPSPKPGILDIAPYVPGKAKAAGFERPIKLSANENALGCSPLARSAYLEAAGRLHAYPDPRAEGLRAAVARHFGLEPERLIFGCGSDELFNLVCHAFLQPGDNVVQPEFGFAAWAIAARLAGAEVKNAPERDLTVDVDALLAAVDARTRIVFLANPANPTGTLLPYAEVLRLHAGLPPHVILVLDGAYAEYAARRPEFGDGLDLAREAENVFVTRTFSKIHGLAGLRVGWGYAASGLIAAMDRVRGPFNTSAAAQAAAIAGLSDAGFMAASVDHVDRWRPIVSEAVAGLGFRPAASTTNFVTFQVPERRASRVAAALAAEGVLIRELRGYGLPDALRVTIGTDEDTAAFLAGLERAAAGA